jgi:hypothetical protein
MMTKSPLAIMFARTESAAKSMTLSSKLWGHAIMLGWLLIFMVSAVGNAIPASYWIDYRSVMVEDVAYGQMPRVTVDRDIKRSVSGDWWAQLEKKVSLRNGFEIMEARRRLDFPVVAAMFRMIAQTGTSIYVPWGKGAELVARLRKGGPSRDLLRRLQRYVIVLHEEDYISDDVETLHWCGGGEKNCDCPLALSTQAVLERYSYRFGWQLRRDGEG